MLFVELLVPKGVFDERERRRLAERLTGRRLLSAADGEAAPVDPDLIELVDGLTHVVVREEEIWSVGGRLLDASQGPRYIVNVVIGMWGRDMSEHLISRVTAELGEMGGTPSRVVVHVIGLREGGYGLHGRAQHFSGIPQPTGKALPTPQTDVAGSRYAFVIETRNKQDQHWDWIVDFGDVVGRGVEDGVRSSPRDFALAAFDAYLDRLVERAPGAVEFFLYEDDETEWRIQVWDIPVPGYDQFGTVSPARDPARQEYPFALLAERVPPQSVVTIPGEEFRTRLHAKQVAHQKAQEATAQRQDTAAPPTGRAGEASPGPEDAS